MRCLHWRLLEYSIFLLLLSNLLFLTPANPTDYPDALRIIRITPAGPDVPPGRQIVFQFDRAVVPLGRMEREASEIPIAISPKLDCQWRWLNPSALACQLDEQSALLPATRYSIVANPGIISQDGATLAEALQHSFTTERPKVKHAWFKTWKSPGMPLIRVIFNQPVCGDSVAKHVYMTIDSDRQHRIGIKVEPDPRETENFSRLPTRGVKTSLGAGAAGSANKDGDEQEDTAAVHQTESRRVWLVSPVVELPLNSRINLKVEPGLVSPLGSESGVENRNLVSFHSFPEFDFEGIECTDNAGKKMFIGPNKVSLDGGSRCNPLRRVALVFSAPVIEEVVKDHLTITPDLAGGRTDYDPWANYRGYSRLRSSHHQGRKYRVWLPEVLQADQVYSIQSDPGEFRDEFGRTLSRSIDMCFATDHRPPDFTLTHSRSVLEKDVDTETPLVVTNLDKISVTYDRLTTKEKQSGRKMDVPIPSAEDIAFRIPLQIRDMLDDQSGVVQGRVESSPPVSKRFEERWFFAQITPFQVHAKVGHYNTLVWVTDLKTGQPVVAASVTIFYATYATLVPRPEILSQAVTDTDGVAILAGTRELDPKLKLIYAYQTAERRLFVKIEKADDLALVPLDQDFRVDTYRASRYTVSPSMRRRYGHIHAWGATAQGVYKAGDTIQYKLYVRDQSNETFVPAPREGYALEIIDPSGKIVDVVTDIKLSEFGAYHGEFTIKKNGAVGWYRFRLKAAFAEQTWVPMKVLVSDFTPAPFKVFTDLNGHFFQPDHGVEVTTRARLHSGGPYTDAASRVTATLQSQLFYSDDPAARGFQFNTFVPGASSELIVHQSEDILDNRGNRVSRFTVPESEILYGRLVVESAVRDDRGKYIAGRAAADYVARDLFVGLHTTGWLMNEDEPVAVDVLVVGAEGKPKAGVPVRVRVERQETKAARVKGAGNAYLTHYTQSWVTVTHCEMQSTLEPVQCVFTPRNAGSHRITATIRDRRDRAHSSEIYRWVVGKGRVLWQERPDNSLEIIAEKSTYRVGDKARYLIKNPFPGAQALITIERYGVLHHWLQTLNSNTPTIEFKVRHNYLPGFFLSVVVTSPRAGKPPSDNQVDLGKPAFRMGYVKVPVTDPYKAIEVQVEPQQDVYKPRDHVKVKLTALPRHPVNGEPVELAVTVLDEAVFDLLVQGRDYFDPYKGFYTVDGLDLENYSLLMRLVGRQKFEKKGANASGGGGADISLRSVFKFVSYWNPSIVTDSRGRAIIEFEVPDNLTGWRVLAMAVTPGDRMGLGEGSFKVNRPTEIRPVMPNQVTEGDSFEAGFSIMNRTSQKRKLNISISAEGVIETAAGQAVPEVTQTLDVDPYKRVTVWLPVKTTGDGRIRFVARGGDELDRDGAEHTLIVQKRSRLESAAVYGSTEGKTITESIHFPEDIQQDVGGLSVSLAPSIIGNLDGAFNYLRDYPYICWEQILTKAVMASHYNNLKPYMPLGLIWKESGQLPHSILEQAAGYQAPNGGMVYYLPEDRNVSPYLSAYTALAFNWLRKSGYEIPAAVEQKLHEYLHVLLRRNAVPDFYTKGMAAAVRAVALAALAEHGKINLSDLQRYQPHVPLMSLFGKAHFLLAASRVAGADAIRADLCQLILAHAGQSGGKFVFSEVIDDGYRRILASTLRTNAAVLSALVAFGRSDKGKQIVGDAPLKLVRYIIQSRHDRGHWENTQENMFCMNALLDYSQVYENAQPNLSLQVRLDSEVMGTAEFQHVRDEAAEFQRPILAGDPGRTGTLRLDRTGQGRLYYSVRLVYARQTMPTDPVNAGIEIHREYSLERNGQWKLLPNPMRMKRGDLVRVDLFISLPTARNFVVVNDPIPGGLEPVDRDLATASVVDAVKGAFDAAGGSWWFRYSDWSSYGVSRWSFYHRELRHGAALFYSEYLPAGNYHLSYTAQAVAPGEFIALPVKAEEMYDPGIYGQGVPAKLKVGR
jgi:uncharacterized protein YfaS (alpha-2-macroglobulin family)